MTTQKFGKRSLENLLSQNSAVSKEELAKALDSELATQEELDAAGGATLPADAAGALLNDGAGNLSWMEATHGNTANTIMVRNGSNAVSVSLVYASGGAIDYVNCRMLDNVAMDAANWQLRTLMSTNGSSSVDWNNHFLSDGVVGPTLDWYSRQAYDSSANTSMDWQSRRLLADGADAIHWGNRTLGTAGGSVVAEWANGFRAQHGTTALRPVLGAGDVGVQYFDTDINQQIFWNGSAWVIPGAPPAPLTATYTLTPTDLSNLTGYPGLTLVSASGLSANQGIVWNSIEFRCDLTVGTPYTTTANLYMNISGNYGGGQKFPAGDTLENSSIGLLTASGRLNRRFVFNHTHDMQIQSGPYSDLLLMADGAITSGTENLYVRIVYQIVDMLP